GDVYCDSTMGAMLIDPSGDDAGFVPHVSSELKCADTVGSQLGRFARAAIRCHRKMADAFFAGKDFNESACEELDPARHKSALEKYAAAMGRLDATGMCTQPCLDRTHRDALALSFLTQLEAMTNTFYPCATTSTTTTSTTSTSSTTTSSTTTSTTSSTT